MKTNKRILCIFLAFAMLIPIFSMTAVADELPKVRNVGTTTFGPSSFEWVGVGSFTASSKAYDGTYAQVDYGQSDKSATLIFDVTETKEYVLSVHAASSATNSNLSNLNFSLDGGNDITFTTGNSTVTALTDPCISSGTYTVKNIKYNTNIMLEKGSHTIVFKVPKVSNNRSEVYFAFECAKLAVADTMSSLSRTSATTFGNSSFMWYGVGSFKTGTNAYDSTYTQVDWGGGVYCPTLGK